MARKTNPLTAVAKRLKKLQVKMDKLNAELHSFTEFVTASTKKTPEAKPVQPIAARKKAQPAKKPAPAKKLAVKSPVKKIASKSAKKPASKPARKKK